MRIVDTIQNVLSGLMGVGDKRASDRFIFIPLQEAELVAAYRGDWISRKIITVPAGDMTRAWRDWQAEEAQIEAIEEEERRLGLRDKVRRAVQLARLHGGAAIIVNDGEVNPALPLRPDSIRCGDIVSLGVVSRWRISVGEIDQNLMSPTYGEAIVYRATDQARGQVDIHPSRVIAFKGADLPEPEFSGDGQGWGDSVLQSVKDAVRHAGLTAQAAASLLDEARIDVVRVPNLADHIATVADQERFTARWLYAMQGKGIFNTLLLDKEEEWETKAVDFAQLPEVLRLYLQVAAGAADIPATRLLGQAPQGMNATGDSDIRNYYDRIASDQETVLRPTLAPLDELLIRSALGSRPPEIHYRWSALWQLSEVERADVMKKRAEATKLYAEAGAIPNEVLSAGVRNMLIEAGDYPGIEAAWDESDATAGIEPDADELALLTAVEQPENVIPIKRAANDKAEPEPAV